jgi:hypothetical protein
VIRVTTIPKCSAQNPILDAMGARHRAEQRLLKRIAKNFPPGAKVLVSFTERGSQFAMQLVPGVISKETIRLDGALVRIEPDDLAQVTDCFVPRSWDGDATYRVSWCNIYRTDMQPRESASEPLLDEAGA